MFTDLLVSNVGVYCLVKGSGSSGFAPVVYEWNTDPALMLMVRVMSQRDTDTEEKESQGFG